VAGSRAATCPACGRTYDKRSPHKCPAAPPEPPPERYPLVPIPHGGPGKCPSPVYERLPLTCAKCGHSWATQLASGRMVRCPNPKCKQQQMVDRGADIIPARGWCDACNDAIAVNERCVLIFDHTEGAGPWPGTCSVPRCQNMVLTGDLCNEHYGERLRGQRRNGRGYAAPVTATTTRTRS
jgi:hypothetical protein